MPSSDQNIKSQLQQLAAYLSQQREALLDDWRARVQQDGKTQDISRWTRSQFQDHIPQVLDALNQMLEQWHDPDAAEPELHQATDEHSRLRWQQGYDLRSLVSEWGYLNECVINQFYNFAASQPVSQGDALRVAHLVWAEMLNQCTSENVVEYHGLLQAEAATRAQELEQVLLHLRSMEEQRGEILRTAAHDLRGGLSVVMGSASIMDEASLSDTARAEIRRVIHRGFTSLNGMLTDLMSMARLEAGQETREINPLDAGELLTTLAMGSQQLAHERGLYLKVEGPNSLPVAGDATKIQRIAQNLLLNSLKYTIQGGVTLKWGDDEKTPDHWELLIEDTGPGLTSGTAAPLAQKLEAATEAAHSAEGIPLSSPGNRIATNNQRPTFAPGEGVGLSIVKRLCELLNASMELQTTEGVGSKFRIVFPKNYESA